MEIRTLIINSNIMAAVALKSALEQTGQFDVYPFSDVSAALEFLKRHRHDVAVVEFGIPHTPGTVVIQRLKALQSDLYIIADVSGETEKIESRRAGAVATLPNRYTARELVDLLRTLLPSEMFRQNKPTPPQRSSLPSLPHSLGEPIKEADATETSSALFERLASEEPEFPAFEDNATITDLMSSIQRDALSVFTSSELFEEWVEGEDPLPYDDTPAKQLLKASQNPSIPLDSIPLDELIARVKGMTKEMPLVKEPDFIKGNLNERVVGEKEGIVGEQDLNQEIEKVQQPNDLENFMDDSFNQVTRPSSVQARLIRSGLTATEPIEGALFQAQLDHYMRVNVGDVPTEQETISPVDSTPSDIPPTPIAEHDLTLQQHDVDSEMGDFDALDESDLFATEPDANDLHSGEMLDVALRLDQNELVFDSTLPEQADDRTPSVDLLVKRDSDLPETFALPSDFEPSITNFDDGVPILFESALLQFANRDAERFTPGQPSDAWTSLDVDDSSNQTAQEFELAMASQDPTSSSFSLAEPGTLEEEERAVAQLALNFTQISMETAAQATILTRHQETVAYAGALTATQLQEIMPAIVNLTPSLAVGQAQIRFVTLPSDGQNYMLYTRLTHEDYLLTMVFAGNTPLKEIRQQSQRLLNALRAVPLSELVGEFHPLEPAETVPSPVTVQPGTPTEAESVAHASIEPASDDSRERIISGTLSASIESFNKFTFVWLLRDQLHDLIKAPTVEAIEGGLSVQWVERGWQFEHVEVTQGYVYIVLDLPSNEVPQNALQLLQQCAAQIAHQQDPYLDVEHLWADSYLMVAPGRRLSNHEILRYINFYHN